MKKKSTCWSEEGAHGITPIGIIICLNLMEENYGEMVKYSFIQTNFGQNAKKSLWKETRNIFFLHHHLIAFVKSLS